MKNRHLLCAALALIAAASLTFAFTAGNGRVVVSADAAEPVVTISYSGGEFSTGSSGYTVTVNGEGIASSEMMTDSFAFTDNTTYLTITAPNDKALIGDGEGMSIRFRQLRDVVSTSANSAKEVLFAVENGGRYAYIRTGSIMYVNELGEVTEANADGVMTKVLSNMTVKDVIVTINAEASEIRTYVDGSLVQYYKASIDPITADVAEMFLDNARTEGSSTYVRKAYDKTYNEETFNYNSEHQVLADMSFYGRCLTDRDAADAHLAGISAGDFDFTEKVAVNYASGAFSTTNANFSITRNGSGITADPSMEGGFRFSDTTTYLTLSAKNGTSISESGAITVIFRHKITSVANSGNWEHWLGVKNGDDTAIVCQGKLYYVTGAYTDNVTRHTATPAGVEDAAKYVDEKLIAITIDPDATNGSISMYIDGKLAQYYNLSSSFQTAVTNSFALFDSELKAANGTLYIRPRHVTQDSYNKKVTSMAGFKLYDRAFTATEVLEYAREAGVDHYESEGSSEQGQIIDVNVTIDGLNESDYIATAADSGVKHIEDAEHPDAIWFSNRETYVTVKAGDNKTLAQHGNGISFSFMQKNTTDVHRDDDGAAIPYATDHCEQLFGVEGADGTAAYIGLGILYYWDGSNMTYSRLDNHEYKIMCTSTWKAATFVVDRQNLEVRLYLDGNLVLPYTQSLQKAEVVANVVNLFSSVASQKGGVVYVRKPFPKRTDRDTATLVIDNLIIGEGDIGQDKINNYYDRLLGNTRIKLITNVSAAAPDLLGKSDTPIVSVAPSMTGYEFVGYYTDAGFSVPLSENALFGSGITSLYAKFDPIVYNIDYHLNGGTQNDLNPAGYSLENKGVSFYPITMKGYRFEGWYRTADFKNQVTYLVPGTMGDLDLYAKFTPAVYTITYELNGGLVVADVTTEYVPEDTVVLVDAWKIGYLFDGWYSDKDLTLKVTAFDTSVMDDVTLYAGYTPEVYTISYVLNGGTLSAGAPTSYDVNSKITLPTAEKDGYTFEGWYYDSALTEKADRFYVSLFEDVSLYAKFEKAENGQPVQSTDEEPKNGGGGCGGTLGFTPVLISILGILGFGIVAIFKKRGERI